MPLYNLACKSAFTPERRQKIARAVTVAHCQQTDAPEHFVNVVFVHGYPLPKPQIASVLGGVRTGGNRTAESIERLKEALHTAIAEAAEVPLEQIDVSLVGIPSNWIIEGGEIMPAPGSAEEQAFNKKHQAQQNNHNSQPQLNEH